MCWCACKSQGSHHRAKAGIHPATLKTEDHMSHIAKAHKITALMLERRQELRTMRGVSYAEEIEPWKRGLRKMMENGLGVMSACAESARANQDNGMAVAWIAAAAVEICEEDEHPMAKKKTADEIAQDKAERERREQIQNDFIKMKSKVADLRTSREFIQAAITSPPFAAILNKFSRDIDETKESLVCADKKDVEKLQAQVIARRGLLGVLGTAYQDELSEATRQLREFEQQHALFLQAPTAQESEQEEADLNEKTA
jgi:hypothetical protein